MKKMLLRHGLFVALILVAAFLVWPNSTEAIPMYTYFEDFQSSVGTEWSKPTTTAALADANRKFLGEFGSESVSLTLTGLPLHNEVTVSTELFIIQSWDGNYPGWPYGPDLWGVSADGSTILYTTFSNLTRDDPSFRQSYPEIYPAGDYPPRTGADENNTLGYYTGPDWTGDSVYNLSATFPHTASSLVLTFFADLQDTNPGVPPSLFNESWGLDNAMVEVPIIPEPASLSLLGLGILGLFGIKRKRS